MQCVCVGVCTKLALINSLNHRVFFVSWLFDSDKEPQSSVPLRPAASVHGQHSSVQLKLHKFFFKSDTPGLKKSTIKLDNTTKQATRRLITMQMHKLEGVFTRRTSPPACCGCRDLANWSTRQNSHRYTHLSRCIPAAPPLSHNSTTAHACLCQGQSAYSPAAREEALRELSLWEWLDVLTAATRARAHTLWRPCISVSASSSVPENLSAFITPLKRIKKPRFVHAHTHTCTQARVIA